MVLALASGKLEMWLLLLVDVLALASITVLEVLLTEVLVLALGDFDPMRARIGGHDYVVSHLI